MSEKKKEYSHFSVKLSRVLYDALSNEAERLDTTMTNVVKTWIREKLLEVE